MVAGFVELQIEAMEVANEWKGQYSLNHHAADHDNDNR